MTDTQTQRAGGSFFTRDPAFYKAFFAMAAAVVLQNLVAYSVNMADNIMLGSYHQDALSGAATVNQVFFMVQQFALSVGNTLVAISAQYWGQKRVEPIRTLTGIAIKLGLIISAAILAICVLIPGPLLSLFSDSPAIIAQGMDYLAIVQWSFALYILSSTLYAALRSVGTVNISFYISIVSLVVNVGINYTLIFGRFGFPELGIRGAAIGTLIARALELVIITAYVVRGDKKLRLLAGDWWKPDRGLRQDFTRVYIPSMCSQVLWGVSVPMQTAILGHLPAPASAAGSAAAAAYSDAAIAANSVATTFYQYLKVVVQGLSATTAVMIGTAIGRGDTGRIRSDARTMTAINLGSGVILGAALILLRHPLLSMYDLTDQATSMALNLIFIMGFVMVGMSYQMPVSFGIIRGGGDASFVMKMNMISTWLIVMPLSFMAAFWWRWPVEAVVLVIQSDQFFKGLPCFFRFRSYKWIKKLTK